MGASVKQIFAPWRIEYVKMEKPDYCVFCKAAEDGDDDKNLIILRGTDNFVILNNYPYNPGHVMVIPYKHVSSIEDLTPDELHEHYDLVKGMVGILREAFEPQGFNIGCNLGKTAGAGIEAHLHTHIVPRWQGDTNFMPVVAETQIIVEELRESYRLIKENLK